MSDDGPVIRIEIDGPKGLGLTDWPAMNPADLVSGQPVQRGHLSDEIEAIDYSVGVWECTAFVDRPGLYPVDEFMLLLEGKVEMEMPDGTAVTVTAGEAFVIPKGYDCQWKMPETVRKIFMILDGATPADADNASLHRITVPSLTADHPPTGALVSRTTFFVNHDNRMRVYIDSFVQKQRGQAPNTGRHIIHVLEGGLWFSNDPGNHFKQGESLYLLPDHTLMWEVQAGTRLLVSHCDLPLSD